MTDVVRCPYDVILQNASSPRVNVTLWRLKAKLHYNSFSVASSQKVHNINDKSVHASSKRAQFLEYGPYNPHHGYEIVKWFTTIDAFDVHAADETRLERINSKHVEFLNLRPNPSVAVVSSSPTQELHNNALDYRTNRLYRNSKPNPLVR